MAYHLALHVVTGAFSIYSLYHKDGGQDVQYCINANSSNGDNNNQPTQEFCEKAFEVLRTIAVVIYVVVILVELCAFFLTRRLLIPVKITHCSTDGCIIVANYVIQLDEEEAAQFPKASTTAFDNASISNPLPQTTYNSYSGNMNYPFRGYDNNGI
jgi:hypothetical protein